ncbi:MAG: helix-hairpin-helix domain-containing protein, partial [Bacteroidota bacterium]
MLFGSIFTQTASRKFALFLKWRFASVFCLLSALLCLTFFPQRVTAQTEETSSGELLENYFRNNEQPNESDAQMLLETYEYLRAHPLNLNTATKEDLSQLGFLNELEIAQFMSYREQFGPFINELELQAVPGWDLFDIKHTLEFAQVSGGLDSRSVRLIKGLYKGENELLMRWGRPNPAPYTGKVEGENNAWALRYRHTFDNRLRFGFTAESDPGEAIFAKSNPHGFDFYSAHLFIQNMNRRVKALAIGDYSARFGQGLLLQTGFAPGKSAET